MSGLMSDDSGAQIAGCPISNERINSRIHDERLFLARRSGKRERGCPGRHREDSLSRHKARAAVRAACRPVRGGLVRQRNRCGGCTGFRGACRFRGDTGGIWRNGCGCHGKSAIGCHDGVRCGRGFCRSGGETGIADASGLGCFNGSCCVNGINGVSGFNDHCLCAGRRVRPRAAYAARACQTHATTGCRGNPSRSGDA